MEKIWQKISNKIIAAIEVVQTTPIGAPITTKIIGTIAITPTTIELMRTLTTRKIISNSAISRKEEEITIVEIDVG